MDNTMKVPRLFYIFLFNRICNITIIYISIDTQMKKNVQNFIYDGNMEIKI